MKLPIAALALALLAPGRPAQDNVLLLLADDVGTDQIGAYGLAPSPPDTPVLDSLAASGVLFRNAWANSLCSPTRATVQTGRYGFRTGIGTIIQQGGESLRPWEITLPEMLDAGTAGQYAHAAFGKWHLGPYVPTLAVTGEIDAPGEAGYSHFAGTLQNLGNYYSYVKAFNGEAREHFGYATSDSVDEALTWLETAPEPWFCTISFHAAHVPLNEPPAHLHGVDFTQVGIPELDTVPYYRATVEAMDTEIGRLLEGVGPALARTTVLFLSDNGSAPEGVLPPFDPAKAKGTLFETGVRVPLLVSGPAVQATGQECQALVNTVDVFATVADLAGVDLAAAVPPDHPLDGVSLLPYLSDPDTPSLRQTIYAEEFAPNGLGPYEHHFRTIRGPRYKLVIRDVFTPQELHSEALYDLELDPDQTNDLLQAKPLAPAEAQAYRFLRGELEGLLEKPLHTAPLEKTQ